MPGVHELAQLNIARMREPMDSPSMADFVANLSRINALADVSPGFVWRPLEDDEPALVERLVGPLTLVNFSVWRDIAALSDYVHKSAHADIMRRRREWFDRLEEASMVLWWVPAGHRPILEEAVDRLTRLRRQGPTPEAFTFASRFDPAYSPQPLLVP
ncbi:MAG: hypothetical protein RL030_1383 [Pseudomonadota bacterium]|jgi:hypothetical protein